MENLQGNSTYGEGFTCMMNFNLNLPCFQLPRD